MGFGRLVRRRLLTHPVALVAVALAVLVSMTVVATLSLLSTGITEASVRTTLSVPERDRTLSASALLQPGQLAAADSTIRAGLQAAVGDRPISRVAFSSTKGLVDRPATDRAQLAEVDGLDRVARLVKGQWPAAAAGGSGGGVGSAGSVAAFNGEGTLPVALPATAATHLGLDLGGQLALSDLLRPDAPTVRVELVGIYEPLDPEAGIWLDDRLSLEGVTRTDFTTIGPFVVGSGTFDAGGVGAVTTTWRTSIGPFAQASDLALVRARLATQVRAFGTSIGVGARQVAGEPPAPNALRNAVVSDRISPLLTQAQATVQRVQISLLTPALLLLLLAGVALVVAAALLASLRDGEVALMRIRGASGRQLGGLALADAGLLVLVGVIGAALLAPVTAGLVIPTGATVKAGLLERGMWLALAAMAVLALALITFTTMRLGRAPTPPGRRTRGGRALAVLTGSGLDLLLVLLGFLGVIQLRRHAGSGSTTIDPLTTAAPTFVIAGLAVVCLRLLPMASARASRLVERRPGFDLAWGGWQVSRRLADQSGTVLLVLLAVAMGTLALAQGATTDRAITDQSTFSTGAPVRVQTASAMWTTPGVGETMAAAAGSEDRAVAVHRSALPLGPAEGVTVLALDSTRAAAVGAPRPDTLGDATWPDLMERLAAGRDLGPGIEFPTGAAELTLTFDVSAPVGEFSTQDSFPIVAHLRDGHGIIRPWRMGAVGLGASSTTAPLPTGPQTLVEPVSLVGLVIESHTVGMFRYVSATSLTTALTRVSVDGQDLSGADQFRAGVVDDQAVLTTPPGTGPLPALITEEVAALRKVGLGDTFSLDLAGRAVPLRVAGLIDAVPTGRIPDRGVIVDLPWAQALQGDGRALVRSPSPWPVQEWWLDPPDPAVTAEALAPQLAVGSTITLRDSLVDERQSNPVNAGLHAAMLLVMGAALVLAAVGFASATAALTRRRRHENAILLALGVPARTIGRTLAIERLGLVLTSVVTGLLLGVVSAYAVVPLIVGGDGHPQVPPVLVTFPWGRVLLLAAGVTAVLMLSGLLVLRSATRNLGGELRRGVD